MTVTRDFEQEIRILKALLAKEKEKSSAAEKKAEDAQKEFEEEKRKSEEEANRKIEEEKRKAEETQRRLEEERRKAEEAQRRLEEEKKRKGVVTGDYVNLRNAPSLSNEPFLRARRGCKLTIHEKTGSFYKVSTNYPKLYVSKKYTNASGEVEANVNVRTEPNLSSECVMITNKGFRIRIMGQSGDFYSFTFPQCYINEDYVKVDI